MEQQIGFPRAVSDEYQSILAESNPKNWAIFGYDKMSNDLKVIGSGEDGLEELAEEWDDSKILYAFTRVIEPISKLPKFVFISWCGDGVPVAKKGLYHHHVNDAVKYFRVGFMALICSFHVHINARAEIDVTPDAIMKKVKDSSGAKYSIHNEQAKKSGPVESVGSSYTPVQTAPKPMSSAPAAFNKPATSIPQQFNNRPPVGSTTSYVPSYAQPRTSNLTSPVSKQSSFSSIPTPAPVAAPTPAFSSSLKGLLAKAVFTYQANEANEISFAEGEIVSEIEKLDEGWWQGKNSKGQVGLFPFNYVDEIKATPAAVVPPAPAPVSAPPPLFNRPSVSAAAAAFNQPSPAAATAIPTRPSVTPASASTFQPYMSSAANAWLNDDESSGASRVSKSSPYSAGFPVSTPAEDRVAAEKERREREDRELRERAEAEARERDAREKSEAEEREERQRAAALSTFNNAAPAAAAASVAAFGSSARAIYDYAAQEANEISFAEGEIITAIEKHDEGWWQGRNVSGHIGLFPSTYVEEVATSASAAPAAVAAPAPPVPAEQIEAVALYDYTATEPNEISFATGDRITNIVFVSEDWWQGRVAGQDVGVLLSPSTLYCNDQATHVPNTQLNQQGYDQGQNHKTRENHQGRHGLIDSDDSEDSDGPNSIATPQSQHKLQLFASGSSNGASPPSLANPSSPASVTFSPSHAQNLEKPGLRSLLSRRTSANVSVLPSSLPRDESPLPLIDSEKLHALSISNGNSNVSISPPPLPPQSNDGASNSTTPPNNGSNSTSQKSLRSQVASTLHKTLQLEHKLTLKELESYEKQSAASELECQRAIAALHAAQVVQRERRRELDLAIMERSGVVAIVRHLRERLEGLRKRMWDGEDAKRRVAGGGTGVGLLTPNSMGYGSGSGLSGLVSSDLFDDDMDLFGTSLSGQQSSGLQSLMNARRHSSPGYAFGGGFSSGFGSSANTSLDEADLLSNEQDDIKNLADTINDASSAEDYGYLGLTDTATGLAEDENSINRPDSMSSLDQAIVAAATTDGGPLSTLKLKSGDESSSQQTSFTFPAVTMTRLHSSGPLSTSSKGSDLASFRRASLGINLQNSVTGVQLMGGNALSPQIPSEMVLTSARLDSLPLGSSVACVSYQRGQCLGTGSEGCKAQHSCVRCGGGHPVILCKKDRNVCVKWNMEAWNSAGTCRIMDCRRLHECIRCGASHPSIICPENLDNYLTEYIAKRRAEGLADDDLLRLELQLTHSLPSSSAVAGAPNGNSGGGISTATTPNPVSASLLPPLPYSSTSLYSHQNSAGMVVGPPLQGQQQQQPLGMRGGDHPMHIAAAAAAMRVVSGGANSAGSTNGRDPYMPQQQQQQTLMIMGQSMYSSGGYSGYDGKGKKNSLSGASAIYEGSLLTENEKSSICRDFNNNKCSADENCRFRHVLIATALLAQRLHDILYGPGRNASDRERAMRSDSTGPNPLNPQVSGQIASLESAGAIAAVLRALLLHISPQIVGVQIPSKEPIEYYHIWGTECVTMCLFIMRKGATLPVHSHPDMTVFSRVIHGDLHVQTYDVLNKEPCQNTHSPMDTSASSSSTTTTPTTAKPLRHSTTTQPPSVPNNHSHIPGRLIRDTIVRGTDGLQSILEINHNTPNLHSFTAESDHVVIFDLLFPPYDEQLRTCTYYEPTENIACGGIHEDDYVVDDESSGDEVGGHGRLQGGTFIGVDNTVVTASNGTLTTNVEAAVQNIQLDGLDLNGRLISSLTSATTNHGKSIKKPRKIKPELGLSQSALIDLVELDYNTEIGSVPYVGQQIRPEQLERGMSLSDSDLLQLGMRVCAMVERMNNGGNSGSGSPKMSK
ncbi:UNVERIFIED_CONTAM: hypothetical protein HDU68_008585 [Siphonaria sp. JEL0065]|nr:hypothetical protein HDU68_008585 [Siphonaria sp. JEL0065]